MPSITCKRSKVLIEGRKVTEESALRLFEKIVGRSATSAERRELAEAWRAAKLPRARPGPAPSKRNGHD